MSNPPVLWLVRTREQTRIRARTLRRLADELDRKPIPGYSAWDVRQVADKLAHVAGELDVILATAHVRKPA